jgi:hypothetical protein
MFAFSSPDLFSGFSIRYSTRYIWTVYGLVVCGYFHLNVSACEVEGGWVMKKGREGRAAEFVEV